VCTVDVHLSEQRSEICYICAVYVSTGKKMQLYSVPPSNSREVLLFSLVSLQCTCTKIILNKSKFDCLFLSSKMCFCVFLVDT